MGEEIKKRANDVSRNQCTGEMKMWETDSARLVQQSRRPDLQFTDGWDDGGSVITSDTDRHSPVDSHRYPGNCVCG